MCETSEHMKMRFEILEKMEKIETSDSASLQQMGSEMMCLYVRVCALRYWLIFFKKKVQLSF